MRRSWHCSHEMISHVMQPDRDSNESTARNEPRRFRLFWVVVVLLLAGHAALGIDAARRLTVTHDEYWHLPVGYLNVKTGRFGFDNLNPPLVRMWAAAPLLLTSAQAGPADFALDGTRHGDEFIAANPQHYFDWYTLGRTMIVLLSVLTGLVLALWAREWFGDAAACLCVLLWASDPNILAHGALVTTDFGATFFFVLTLYALWKYAERVTWSRALLFGLCLGLSQLAKYTSILLYPLSIVLWLVYRLRNETLAARPVKNILLQWFAAWSLSLLVLNAGYFFEGTCSRLGSYQFGSQTLIDWSTRLEPLDWVPVPLPRAYVRGIDRQRSIMEGRHPVFLDGQWRTDGFGHYYVMALLYKVPHALQLLVMLCGLFLIRPGNVSRRPRIQSAILVPAALLLAVAGTSGMQLGVRYVLPMLPFMILFAGQVMQWFQPSRYWLRSALVALLIVAAPLSLRYHPQHLAYFNESAGGPVGGRDHLLDSNLDWGQDLRALKRYLETHDLPDLGLAYFGTVPPHRLDIEYRVPPPRSPQPGWYAVSVNFVKGRPHWLRKPDGEIRPVDFQEFGYFQFLTPVDRVGTSIDIYNVTEADVERWRRAVNRQVR